MPHESIPNIEFFTCKEVTMMQRPIIQSPLSAPVITVTSMKGQAELAAAVVITDEAKLKKRALRHSMVENKRAGSSTTVFAQSYRYSAATVLQGTRDSQQDAAFTCGIQFGQPIHWSPGHCGQLLANLLFKLGYEIKDYFNDKQLDEQKRIINSGSTLCVAMIHQNNVYVANVGDSYAILVLPEENQEYSCRRLNRLHTASNPDEQQRIKALNCGAVVAPHPGYAATYLRFNGVSVMTTRNIGNTNFWPAVSCAADVSMTTVDLNKHPGAMVFTMSDGCDSILEQEFSHVIGEFFRATPQAVQSAQTMQALTRFIAERAFLWGSNDNITVNGSYLACPNTIPMLQQSHCVTLCLTADGHGEKGDIIAAYIKTQVRQFAQDLVMNFESQPTLQLTPLTAAVLDENENTPTPPDDEATVSQETLQQPLPRALLSGSSYDLRLLRRPPEGQASLKRAHSELGAEQPRVVKQPCG
jgi:serine/threonine protein phosphatase PrpC